MSSHPDEFGRLLDRLDAEVDAVANPTPESRARLHRLTQEIRQLAQEPVAAAAPTIEQHSRLASVATHFEADHPAIAAALRQLADTLGKAGV